MPARRHSQPIEANVAQPEGCYWQDNIYLAPTSDVDGRKRWQTIILLLAGKLKAEDGDTALAKFRLFEKSE
jgi:hypothetical protein